MVQLLNAKLVSAGETHRQLMEVYGDCDESTTCGKMVYTISNRASDSQRRSAEWRTNGNRYDSESSILQNRSVTVNKLTLSLNLSRGKVSRMAVQMRFHKVCADLSVDHTEKRMAYASVIPGTTCHSRPRLSGTNWHR